MSDIKTEYAILEYDDSLLELKNKEIIIITSDFIEHTIAAVDNSASARYCMCLKSKELGLSLISKEDLLKSKVKIQLEKVPFSAELLESGNWDVTTRDGTKVYDANVLKSAMKSGSFFSVAAFVDGAVRTFTHEGFAFSKSQKSGIDLFLKEKIKTVKSKTKEKK